MRGLFFILLFLCALSRGESDAYAADRVIQEAPDGVFLIDIPEAYAAQITAFLPDIRNGLLELSEARNYIDVRKQDVRLFLAMEPPGASCVSAFGTIEAGESSFEFGAILVNQPENKLFIAGAFSNGCAESKWPDLRLSSIDSPCREHLIATFHSSGAVHVKKTYADCRHR